MNPLKLKAKHIISILFVLLALFLLFRITTFFQEKKATLVFQTAAGDVTLNVEIADTPEKHTKGLMGRVMLAEDKGMLFIFSDTKQRNFWMKNTYVSLDIMFIDENKKVIEIVQADPCANDPCRIYSSRSPAKYVLEVNQGFAEAAGIFPGTQFSINE